MRVKAFLAFRLKLSMSCKSFVSIFRFKLSNPVSIRALIRRPCHVSLRQPSSKKRLGGLPSFFRFLKKKNRKMDRLKELTSFSDAVSDRKLMHSPVTKGKKLYPSPITPAYAPARKTGKKEFLRDENVEDACRNFENYLVQMIVDEGRIHNLTDIEELLYVWRNLKSPVFIDLVSRFYGDLCQDLFSADDDHNEANRQ